MKTLYLDLFSGISGDMFIGALIDLGVDAKALESELSKLNLDGYHLHISRGAKCGISGIKFDVHLESEHSHSHEHHGHDAGHSHDHDHDHGAAHTHTHRPHSVGQKRAHSHAHEHGRSFGQIRDLIRKSAFSAWVQDKAVAVFTRIAVAEGKIHGLPPEQVHFHEVGAVDSIIDIVGGCVALEMLGKPSVQASPVVEGFGWVNCAHGRFPIPAPATLAILGARGVPVSQCEETSELVTPTGAAILAEFAESFAPMRDLVADKIGFGLGTRDNKTRPNVLRAILSSAASQPRPVGASHDWEIDEVAVLEANLDDISPEVLGHFVENALAASALDVFYTPVQMKKSRPGVLVSVLCEKSAADKLTELLLRETGTFGVRRSVVERRKLARSFVTVPTVHGEVVVKLGCLDGQVLHAAPEFESCKNVAAEARVPIKDVYAAAQAAARTRIAKPGK